MPTYDYRCKECGHAFEELQSMSADALIECPSCGKPALKRLMTAGAGMIFKGSGFYLTDYKKTSSDTTESKPKTESKKEGDTQVKKSDPSPPDTSKR
ncbi:MAG TPA: FmdB family transcriptional regulator [Bacteroidetes bacterium]|nr:FmdB family transcriptional regulator [Bacteroidota bacterium]